VLRDENLFYALAGLFWRFFGKYGGEYYGDLNAWFGACQRGHGLAFALLAGASGPRLNCENKSQEYRKNCLRRGWF